ncbi:class I SAM-dependent methyltransferase [Dongia deserti]|uniref:class I SAM-dependent methyltransferase n=1 Tax=Dongia deserti TaxID=2268030 RepID=UPI000E6507FA|nr:class I SAM-dependent methyltransferase [Dongia deserti]
MQTKQSTQSWSEETSASFIAYGRFFNPERERQFDVIGDLVGAAVERESTPLIVELCCGAGDLAVFLLGKFPTARYVALDGSAAMLAETTRQCAPFRDRLTTQTFDLGSDDWRWMREQPRVIVSSLAVHHLDGNGKRKLFRDLHCLLKPGGAFVLADIMRPASEAGFALAAEAYERAVAMRSLEELGDLSMLDKLRELRWNYFRYPDDDAIDQPSTIKEHLAWLEEAGFRGVDLYWALASHAIVSGTK